MRFLLRHGGDKRSVHAFRERQELVQAGLTRRDLVKLGILTGAGTGGRLVFADKSLADDGRRLPPLPPLQPFVLPLRLLEPLPGRPALDPVSTDEPNHTIDQATGIAVEGRSERHQSRDVFGVQQQVPDADGRQRGRDHPSRPAQADVLGLQQGRRRPRRRPRASPGPISAWSYLQPAIVRRINQLPAPEQNGGFGVPETSTHLHNFHSAPDSDGGPCDPVQERFFSRGQYYDYYYNVRSRAGTRPTSPTATSRRRWIRCGTTTTASTTPPRTPTRAWSARPSSSTRSTPATRATGFRLPRFPDFDIPMMFADKLIDPTTGLLAFDTFNIDGLLGDTFVVNGMIQPFFEVKPRRYRFRFLDGGPSRFYQLYLTNPDNLRQSIPLWVIANDGNLLPRPVQATAFAWRSPSAAT